MTPRQWANCAQVAWDFRDREAFTRALDHLLAAAERDHPITTDVLTRTPAKPAPLEPSDSE